MCKIDDGFITYSHPAILKKTKQCMNYAKTNKHKHLGFPYLKHDLE